jgi:hypothetical protein
MALWLLGVGPSGIGPATQKQKPGVDLTATLLPGLQCLTETGKEEPQRGGLAFSFMPQ